MKTKAFAILSFVLVCGTAAYADTFGTDPNTTFEIEFVDIGNAGILADTDDGDSAQDGIQNFGSVSYFYRMGKYEISEDMIAKANAQSALNRGFRQRSRRADLSANANACPRISYSLTGCCTSLWKSLTVGETIDFANWIG